MSSWWPRLPQAAPPLGTTTAIDVSPHDCWSRPPIRRCSMRSPGQALSFRRQRGVVTAGNAGSFRHAAATLSVQWRRMGSRGQRLALVSSEVAGHRPHTSGGFVELRSVRLGGRSGPDRHAEAGARGGCGGTPPASSSPRASQSILGSLDRRATRCSLCLLPHSQIDPVRHLQRHQEGAIVRVGMRHGKIDRPGFLPDRIAFRHRQRRASPPGS